MDKLSAMRTFVRVAEAGSFSAVAMQTGTTQSAVSKQVAALERTLGVRLLARTTRSISLTGEGARYLDSARRLLGEIEAAESALHAGATRITGWIRVAASVGFGRMKLLPLVVEFMATHPGVNVDLQLHDGYVDLVEQGIDVSVRIGDLQDSGLLARPLGASRRCLVAHREHLDRLREGVGLPTRPEDLPRHNCLVYTGLASRNLWTFTANAGASEPPGTVRSVRVGGTLQTNSSEVMRGAVLAGLGLAYTPDWLFETELADGLVQRVMPQWDSPPSLIHLVSPPERRHSARVAAFGDFLARRLATPQAAGAGAQPA